MNKESKKRNATVTVISHVSGYHDIKKNAKSIGNQINQSASNITALASKVRDRFKKPNARSETFEQAVERLSLTEDKLASRRIDFMRMLVAVGLVTLLTFYFGLWHYAAGHTMLAINAVCFMAVEAALLFKYAFLIWQLDRRYLGSVQEWIASRQIWPGSALKGEHNE